MGRFEPDFAGTTVTTPVYPDGEYEVEIRDARPISYIRDDDGKHVAGVRYFFEMKGRVNPQSGEVEDEVDGMGNIEGKDVTPNRVYLHSEEAWGMTKQFLLAAFGYRRKPEDEAQFNEEVLQSHDFGLDFEEGAEEDAELGDGWKACVGNRVRVFLSEGTYNDAPSQEFGRWAPIS